MDPIAVLKTLWNYKILVIPVVIITIIAGVYVFKFGPRQYEVNTSYAIVSPSIPTERQIEKNPKLDSVNKDNPYLRSSDPSLITDVVVTLLNSSATEDELKSAGLGPDYSVGQGVNSNGFVVDVTGISDSPSGALSTTKMLGEILERDLHKIQKVNDADDSYLYTALVVAPPDRTTEQFSSRLRSLIVVAIAGGVLLIGAVSIGRSFSEMKKRRRNRKTESSLEKDEMSDSLEQATRRTSRASHRSEEPDKAPAATDDSGMSEPTSPESSVPVSADRA